MDQNLEVVRSEEDLFVNFILGENNIGAPKCEIISGKVIAL